MSAMQTYASICILLADKRPKPLLQANVLNRALFEVFATIVALTEDQSLAPRSLPESRTSNM